MSETARLKELVEKLIEEMDVANKELGGYFNELAVEIAGDLNELGIESRILQVDEDI